jgi:hypothetical protein
MRPATTDAAMMSGKLRDEALAHHRGSPLKPLLPGLREFQRQRAVLDLWRRIHIRIIS